MKTKTILFVVALLFSLTASAQIQYATAVVDKETIVYAYPKYWGSITTAEIASKYGNSSVKAIGLPGAKSDDLGVNFNQSHNLKSVKIPKSVNRISSYAFFQCWNLSAIDLPESITEIESNAFCYCTSLKSIKIPNNVTRLNSIFVGNYSLETVEIGANVTTIHYTIFQGCNALKDIYILAEFPPATTPDDEYCDQLGYDVPYETCTLHVPYGSLERYSEAYGWRKFLNIVEDQGGLSGVSEINSDAVQDVEYYNLQGDRVEHPESGVYIRRQGNKTTKIIL